jgi:large subunit ribosomal protein L15
MRQNDLSPAPGSKRKRKRVGRGLGSGHGCFSGRGAKGQKARAGGHLHPRFEGGQTPLVERLPRKRGFTHPKTEYSVVNVGRLSVFEENAVVTPETLAAVGLVKSSQKPVKVLGDGVLKKPLTVRASSFSAKARDKIAAAGGKVEEIEGAPGKTAI